jgi:hypothetical protein
MIVRMRARWILPVLVAFGCGPSGGNGDDDQPHDANTAPDARSTFGDADGDGISDGDEGRYDPSPPDTDGDGTPDWMDTDSDADGLSDEVEGTGDDDGDGVPNWIDPTNDGPPASILLTQISTTFNSPIGIDYHEPSDTVVMSVNYPTGSPSNFETIAFDGTHSQFSAFANLTEEVKIATARGGNPAGIPAGTLFCGNGVDGQIVRISADGTQIDNPWVTLPGVGPHGLMRGSLYVDRTGLYNGDLIVVTTEGEVWRIDAAGNPTMLTDVNVHLEGVIVVPDVPVRYGPLAGKIIAGAEEQIQMWAFDATGAGTPYNLGVAIEDIDLVTPDENFFGVNFGTSHLLGATAADMASMRGDVLLTTETVTAGTSGLYRLKWDGTTLTAELVPLEAGSATVGQWEHTTLAPAGILEIPPVQ